MKRFLTNCLRKTAMAVLILSPLAMQGQQAKIQNWRPYDQSGINAVSYTHLTLPTNREV